MDNSVEQPGRPQEVALSVARLKQDVIDEMGEEWWDRYGEASLRAALVVSGEIPAAIVVMFDVLAAL